MNALEHAISSTHKIRASTLPAPFSPARDAILGITWEHIR